MKILILTNGINDNQRIISESLKECFCKHRHSCEVAEVHFISYSKNWGTFNKITVFRYLFDNDFDVVITTHIDSLKFISEFKGDPELDFLLFHVQNDYCHYSEYKSLPCDAYFLPDAGIAEHYTGRIDDNKIIVSGIPTSCVSSCADLHRVTSTYIDGDACALFVGGFEILQILDLADELSKLCHVIIVCEGGNFELHKDLNEAFLGNNDVTVVTDIDLSSKVISFAVASPYSIYSTVSLNSGVPLIILSPTPEYKCENYLNMCDMGMGIGCMNTREVLITAKALLHNPSISAFSEYTASKCRHKDSAEIICSKVHDYYKKHKDNKERGI